MARAAVAAAGVGDESEFAVLARLSADALSLVHQEPCGAGAVSFMSYGSTRLGGTAVSGKRLWPKWSGRRDSEDAGSSWGSPTTS